MLAGLFLVAGAYVGAQEKAPAPEKGMGQMAPPASPEGAKDPPYTKPFPMGFVSIELKHMGAGVGLAWGNGFLTYKGKQYTFKVKGLQIGTVGISKLTAKGEVYNLFDLAEFPGQYGAAEASVAVFKGKVVSSSLHPASCILINLKLNSLSFW